MNSFRKKKNRSDKNLLPDNFTCVRVLIVKNFASFLTPNKNASTWNYYFFHSNFLVYTYFHSGLPTNNWQYLHFIYKENLLVAATWHCKNAQILLKKIKQDSNKTFYRMKLFLFFILLHISQSQPTTDVDTRHITIRIRPSFSHVTTDMWCQFVIEIKISFNYASEKNYTNN